MAVTYTELREQLDMVMGKLQDTDCSVDEALALFKQGQDIIKKMRKVLQVAENTVVSLAKEEV